MTEGYEELLEKIKECEVKLDELRKSVCCIKEPGELQIWTQKSSDEIKMGNEAVILTLAHGHFRTTIRLDRKTLSRALSQAQEKDIPAVKCVVTTTMPDIEF